MSPTLLSLFAEVPDPRRGQGKMYPLAPILLFTVLAMLSGAVSYRQVHAFIKTHLDRLNAAFDLSLRRAPAYSSVRFILRGLDGAVLESAFRRHAATLGAGGTEAGDAAAKPVCVAIDGKIPHRLHRHAPRPDRADRIDKGSGTAAPPLKLIGPMDANPRGCGVK